MNADIATANLILAEVRDRIHPHCRISGSANPEGLQLKFRMEESGDVVADFDCHPRYQGYSEIVHGGVLAAMMDSAMVNSLFARRIDAVTAELVVRYRGPVRLSVPAQVRARIAKASRRLYVLDAEVVQDGQIMATSTAKFMALPDDVDKSARLGRQLAT